MNIKTIFILFLLINENFQIKNQNKENLKEDCKINFKNKNIKSFSYKKNELLLILSEWMIVIKELEKEINFNHNFYNELQIILEEFFKELHLTTDNSLKNTIEKIKDWIFKINALKLKFNESYIDFILYKEDNENFFQKKIKNRLKKFKTERNDIKFKISDFILPQLNFLKKKSQYLKILKKKYEKFFEKLEFKQDFESLKDQLEELQVCVGKLLYYYISLNKYEKFSDVIDDLNSDDILNIKDQNKIDDLFYEKNELLLYTIKYISQLSDDNFKYLDYYFNRNNENEFSELIYNKNQQIAFLEKDYNLAQKNIRELQGKNFNFFYFILLLI